LWGNPRFLLPDHFNAFTPATPCNATADRIVFDFREFGPPFATLDGRFLTRFQRIEKATRTVGLDANSVLNWSAHRVDNVLTILGSTPLDLFRIGLSPVRMSNLLKTNHRGLSVNQQIGSWPLSRQLLPAVLRLSRSSTNLAWLLPFVVFAHYCLQTVLAGLERADRIYFMQLSVWDRASRFSITPLDVREVEAAVAMTPSLDELVPGLAADLYEAEVLLAFREAVLGASAVEPFVSALRGIVIDLVLKFASHLSHAHIKVRIAKALRIGPLLENRFYRRFDWLTILPAAFVCDQQFVRDGAHRRISCFFHSSAVLAFKLAFLATPVEIVLTIYGQEGRWTRQFICTVPIFRR
jgi:hypothetical protein